MSREIELCANCGKWIGHHLNYDGSWDHKDGLCGNCLKEKESDSK